MKTLRSAGGLRVLVVEDCADCADSLALLLVLWGHAVAVARDGGAALRLERGLRPDAVLLDIGPPGALDAWEVARRIRADGAPGVPLLIAVTGPDAADDRRRAAEAGIDLHLVKPADSDQLRRALREFRPPLTGASLSLGATG